MKKILLLISIYCFVTSSIIAQDNNQVDYIRGGAGFSVVDGRYGFTPKVELEDVKPISQRFNFGASVNLGYRQNRYSASAFTGINKIVIAHIDPSIYFKIDSTKDLRVYVGLGPSLIFETRNDVSNGGSFRDSDFLVRGNIIFQMNHDLDEETAFGLRFSAQPTFEGIFAGISFNLIKKINRKTND